jgi:hypothetical protein
MHKIEHLNGKMAIFGEKSHVYSVFQSSRELFEAHQQFLDPPGGL